MKLIIYIVSLLCLIFTHTSFATCTNVVANQNTFPITKNVNQLYPGPTGTFLVVQGLTLTFTGCAPSSRISIFGRFSASDSDNSKGFPAIKMGSIGDSPPSYIYGSVIITQVGNQPVTLPVSAVDTQIGGGVTDANGTFVFNVQSMTSNMYTLTEPTSATGEFTGRTTYAYISETGSSSGAGLPIFGNFDVVKPANCTINAGNNYNVTFPSIKRNDITTVNMPVSAAKKDVSLNVACSGVAGGIDAQISGAQTAGSRSALITTNPDIGILVTDSSGADIAIGSGVIPIILSNGNGILNFALTPMNINGSVPATGTYTAVATVNVYVP